MGILSIDFCITCWPWEVNKILQYWNTKAQELGAKMQYTSRGHLVKHLFITLEMTNGNEDLATLALLEFDSNYAYRTFCWALVVSVTAVLTVIIVALWGVGKLV